jgi:hypothetical protein
MPAGVIALKGIPRHLRSIQGFQDHEPRIHLGNEAGQGLEQLRDCWRWSIEDVGDRAGSFAAGIRCTAYSWHRGTPCASVGRNFILWLFVAVFLR